MGWTEPADVYDILGFRVTQATLSAVLQTMRRLTHVLQVVKVKCYGVCECPIDRADACEEYTPYREDGYRRIHLIVRVPQFERQAEIQLCTPYMTQWADWSHEFLYKPPQDIQ